MSAGCHHHGPAPGAALQDGRYRRALIVALAVNAIMFAVEIAAGIGAGSQALKADALDFLGDAATYAISLLVLPLSLRWRATAALAKGLAMASFGLWVGWEVLRHLLAGTIPAATTMSLIGLLALAANLGVAILLFRWRTGDANMRSVWLCTRNDAIGNVAVVAAAGGVFATGAGWPDLAVAALMAGLALWSAGQIVAASVAELRRTAAA